MLQMRKMTSMASLKEMVLMMIIKDLSLVAKQPKEEIPSSMEIHKNQSVLVQVIKYLLVTMVLDQNKVSKVPVLKIRIKTEENVSDDDGISMSNTKKDHGTKFDWRSNIFKNAVKPPGKNVTVFKPLTVLEKK